MNNKRTILTIAPIVVVATLLLMTPLLAAQSVSAKKNDKIDFSQSNLEQPYFNVNKDGTTTFSSTPITTDHSNSASAARSDSASAARSDNNVKCFAFCRGISSANSGSAANSDSRTNSPGDTTAALPVSPQTTVNPNEITPLNTKPESNNNHNNHNHGDHPITNDILADNGIYPSTIPNIPTTTATATTGGTACIDNTGSAQDSGYAQGYVDGNRDSVYLNGHGFDDSLSGNHTPEFRQGYHDGYHSGFEDGKKGINLQQC